MMTDSALHAAWFALLFPPALLLAVGYALWRYIRQEGTASPVQTLWPLAVVLIAGGGWLTLSPNETPRSHTTPTDNTQLLASGKALFSLHCAICHGETGTAPDGKGANLTHRISFESALLNIQRGANNFKRTFPGGMPPMIADTDRAAQVAHYVSSGFSENDEGKMLYERLRCERCHGANGRGREYLGPNIRDFDLNTVALVLKQGKNGVIGKMPKFDHFNEQQVKALGLYVISLSPNHK